MFKWLFKSNKEVEAVEEMAKNGFERVKDEVNKINQWIKYLDTQKGIQGDELKEIKESLSSLNDEIEGLKNMISLMGYNRQYTPIKTPRQLTNKQTVNYDVVMGVQTTVQTPNLNNFTVNERALIWILLTTDMKLSYEDLAAMIGKEKSTIRSQINAIRQKDSGIIEEKIEKNGKKRVYIPDQIKEMLQKKMKVKLEGKKDKNKEKTKE